MAHSIADLLREAVVRLGPASPTPRLDAELLLAHVLGWPRARLLAERAHTPPRELAATFAALVTRRAALEPVAYIVGRKEFYGLDLLVTPATLIPRPETELLVELALVEARRRNPQPAAITIADIGTGTGAIAIALAVALPQATVYATELSAAALAVASANVERHGLAGRVHLIQGDLLQPVAEPVHLIVSNPPYTIIDEVEPNVRAHEPRLALDGGPDGAAIYRRLVATAPQYLRPGGALLLEVGCWQAELVAGLVRAAMPGAIVAVYRDLAGHDRVVVGGDPVAGGQAADVAAS